MMVRTKELLDTAQVGKLRLQKESPSPFTRNLL